MCVARGTGFRQMWERPGQAGIFCGSGCVADVVLHQCDDDMDICMWKYHMRLFAHEETVKSTVNSHPKECEVGLFGSDISQLNSHEVCPRPNRCHVVDFVSALHMLYLTLVARLVVLRVIGTIAINRGTCCCCCTQYLLPVSSWAFLSTL